MPSYLVSSFDKSIENYEEIFEDVKFYLETFDRSLFDDEAIDTLISIIADKYNVHIRYMLKPVNSRIFEIDFIPMSKLGDDSNIMCTSKINIRTRYDNTTHPITKYNWTNGFFH